jgi:hypothetical protein
MKIRWPLIALLLSLSGTSAAAETPREVVRTFYEALIYPEPRFYGEPDYRRVERTLSPVLARALKAQEEYENACVAITPPDMKPYIMDQTPFFLAPDGAKTLGKLTQVISGGTAKVSAHLAYDEIEWADTVTLVRQGNRWLIVDVAWGDGDGGSLVERLKGFAKYRCASN